ncbi:unknown [Prevotella sp. CAG:487]|nr:unknown [Prevotella sp. CAG:487]
MFLAFFYISTKIVIICENSQHNGLFFYLYNPINVLNL